MSDYISVNKYALYDTKLNQLRTTSSIGFLEALNTMFHLGILTEINKTRLSNFNCSVSFSDGTSVTKLTPRTLLQYLKETKNVPIDLNNSRNIISTNVWSIKFTEEYAYAVQKQLELEASEEIIEQTDIQENNTTTNNQEGDTTNEENDWSQKEEDCTNDAGIRNEAELSQDQKDAKDEQGTPTVAGTGSTVSESVELKPEPPKKKRGPKAKAQ